MATLALRARKKGKVIIVIQNENVQTSTISTVCNSTLDLDEHFHLSELMITVWLYFTKVSSHYFTLAAVKGFKITTTQADNNDTSTSGMQ